MLLESPFRAGGPHTEFNRLGLMPQVQGADTCSLHAVASLAEFEIAEREPRPKSERSTEFLIWAAKKATGKDHDQAMFYEALCGLNHSGFAVRPSCPKPARATHGGLLGRGRGRRQRTEQPLEGPLDQALGPQATAGRCADPGHQGGLGPRPSGGLRFAMAQDPQGFELIQVPPPMRWKTVIALHWSVTPTTPQNNGGVFLFRNSWGPKWGKNGYGSISYAYTRTYANDVLWLELGPPNSEVPVERFEAIALPVVASGRCRSSVQDMGPWERAMWSQGKQLFCAAEKEGFVELAMQVRKPGRYRFRVLATAGPDFGMIRMALDGKGLKPQFDLYCGRVSPSGTLELGTHAFTAGRHRIRFHNVGKNTASAGYFFGIDAIDLLPHAPSR